MFTLLEKPKSVVATATLANEFASMKAPLFDKPLKERRINVYTELYLRGEFRPVDWASAYCQDTEHTYRVNGKHTSVMLTRLNGEGPEFIVNLQRYSCDNLEDVARLYATFDTKLSTRTSSDTNHAYCAACPDLHAVSLRTINLAVSGMSYYTWKESYAARPVQERAELMLVNVDFVLWLWSILDVKPRPTHIARGPVVAVMFGSWKKSRASATEFWQAVRDEAGSKPTLPDRKLAKWLNMNTVLGHGHNVVRKAGTREFYVKCIHAWNAWRRNETTDMKYFPKVKIPSFR